MDEMKEKTKNGTLRGRRGAFHNTSKVRGLLKSTP